MRLGTKSCIHRYQTYSHANRTNAGWLVLKMQLRSFSLCFDLASLLLLSCNQAIQQMRHGGTQIFLQKIKRHPGASGEKLTLIGSVFSDNIIKLMIFQEANHFDSPHPWELPQQELSLNHSVEESSRPESPLSFDALLESKQKMGKFVATLQEHRKSELRGDVLEHCAQLNRTRKVIPNYISDQTILRMLSSRIDKMLKNRKIKKNWSEEDLKILVWTISKYADLHNILDLEKDISHEDWNNIATLIPGVNPQSCMFKWLSIKKINLSVQHWQFYESNLLRAIVEEELRRPGIHPNSINWKAVAQTQYKLNESHAKVFRSAKQCREHWNCYLNPQIKKGPWKIEEDIQLLTLIRSNNGDKKWSEIVYSFEGRTENALKNRYTLLIQKQKKISKSKQQKSLIQDCLERCVQVQSLATKQRRSVFISEVLTEQKNKDQREQQGSGGLQITESCSMQEMIRSDSQTTVVEEPPVVIKFFKMEEFDLLKQMAMSRYIRPGCVKDGKFQSEF